MKNPISLYCLLAAIAGMGTASAVPIINEVMSSNDTALADADGDFPDWIELYNPAGEAYSLEGHYLTDDQEDLERWAFPDDAEVPAGGYLVLFASGKDRGSGLDLDFTQFCRQLLCDLHESVLRLEILEILISLGVNLYFLDLTLQFGLQ